MRSIQKSRRFNVCRKVARAFLQVATSVGDLAMMGRIYQIATD